MFTQVESYNDYYVFSLKSLKSYQIGGQIELARHRHRLTR